MIIEADKSNICHVCSQIGGSGGQRCRWRPKAVRWRIPLAWGGQFLCPHQASSDQMRPTQMMEGNCFTQSSPIKMLIFENTLHVDTYSELKLWAPPLNQLEASWGS